MKSPDDCKLCNDPVEDGEEWHCPDHWGFVPFVDGVAHHECVREQLAYETGFAENFMGFGVIKF